MIILPPVTHKMDVFLCSFFQLGILTEMLQGIKLLRQEIHVLLDLYLDPEIVFEASAGEKWQIQMIKG